MRYEYRACKIHVSRCLGMIIHKEGFISLRRIHPRKHSLILSSFKIDFCHWNLVYAQLYIAYQLINARRALRTKRNSDSGKIFQFECEGCLMTVVLSFWFKNSTLEYLVKINDFLLNGKWIDKNAVL